MSEVARMRTIKKALVELRATDKETCITENFIRGAVREKKIRSIKAGNRYLVDLSDLENLLDSMTSESLSQGFLGIRKIEVRR